jgi:hypothetical protein
VTKIRRQYGWLVLAGYLSLAAAVPMLTPAPQQDFALPPIAPLALADNFESDAMMLPLRQQAGAALHALQMSRAREQAAAF